MRADGTIDGGFGDGGKLPVECGKAVVGPDGMILVVSNEETSNGAIDPVVARFFADGRPDLSFGQDGRVVVDLGRRLDFADAIALTSDGDIAIAGLSASHIEERLGYGDGVDVIARLLPGGSLDPSFSGDGVQRLQADPESVSVSALAAGPNGALLVEAEQQEAAAVFVDRVRPDGSLDPSFGTGGRVAIRTTHPAPGAEFLDAIGALGVLPSGKVVVAGTAFSKAGRGERLVVIRLLRNGRRDRSFGGHGTAQVALHNFGVGAAMTLGGDEDLLFGVSNWAKGEGIEALALTPRGRLDNRFGRGGRFKFRIPGFPDVGGIALRPSGRAVIGGEVDSRTVLALTPPLPPRGG